MDVVERVLGLLVLWHLLLTALVIIPRAVQVLAAGRPINSFDASGKGESGFMQRTVRAHANMVETSALLYVPMIWALVADKGELLAPFVVWVFFARVIQSSVHLISTSPIAVNLRFAFFLPQLVFAGYSVHLLLNG